MGLLCRLCTDIKTSKTRCLRRFVQYSVVLFFVYLMKDYYFFQLANVDFYQFYNFF